MVVYGSWSTRLAGHASPVTVETLQSQVGLLDGTTLPSGLSAVLLVIPGNPGVVHFYEELCKSITAHRPECGVVVSSYLGHSLLDYHDGKAFELQCQMDLFDAMTEHLVQRCRPVGVKLLLAGHSIGGLVVKHMVARHDVHKGFMLTPTIMKMRQSPNGQAKHRLLHPIGIHGLSTLAGALGLLPPRVTFWIAEKVERNETSAKDGLPPRLRNVVVQMARRSLVKNVLTMARSEFLQVDDLDAHVLAAAAPRLVFYFVPGDEWVPPADVAHITEQLRGTGAVVLHDAGDAVPHAWCVNHTQQVVERVLLPHL